MIELTKEEALVILRALSLIDGYLMSVDGSQYVAEQLAHPLELLAARLVEDD